MKIPIKLLLAGVVLAFFGAASASADPAGDKVTICHATGSATNPFNAITVSVTSGDLTGALAKSGHFDANGNPASGHEQDFFVTGDVDKKTACGGSTSTPPPTTTPGV
jgi:hypothetical protein